MAFDGRIETDQVIDDNGDPVAGARIVFKKADTSTDQAASTDKELTTPAANPFITDSGGRYAVYLNPLLSYTITQQSADGGTTYKTYSRPSINSGGQGSDLYFVVDTLAEQQALAGDDAEDVLFRLGRTAAGDHPIIKFRWSTADESANVTIDTGKVLYVPPASDATGASGCWVLDEGEYARGLDVRIAGAKLDYVSSTDTGTDDKDAFTNAYKVVSWVHVPAGDLLLSDGVAAAAADGRLSGASHFETTIWVSESHATAAFNQAATGVIIASGSNFRCEDIGFDFKHADATETVRANVTTFPPAIDLNGKDRCHIDNIRISTAWDGIDATDNVGGSYFGRLEIGALNKGIDIDGALDFVHIDSLHFWPFGNPTDSGLGSIYRDGETIAIEIGRCDNFTADKISVFQAKVKRTGAVGPSVIAAQIGELALDGNHAEFISDGYSTEIGVCYSTKDGADSSTIQITNGRTIIGEYHGTQNNRDDIDVSGAGELIINGGWIQNQLFSRRIAYVSGSSGARLTLRNVEFDVPTTARTVPIVEQSGTDCVLIVQNCTASDGSNGGPKVKVGNDLAGHHISGNDFNGWDLELPSTVQNGCYGPNNVGPVNFSPTVGFETPGDSSPTYDVQTGKAYFRADGVEVKIALQFDLNAYTTASGGFRITIPFLPNLAGTDSMVLGPALVAVANWDNTYTQVIAVLRTGQNQIQLLQQGDSLSVSGMDTANFVASSNNNITYIAGFIPLR